MRIVLTDHEPDCVCQQANQQVVLTDHEPDSQCQQAKANLTAQQAKNNLQQCKLTNSWSVQDSKGSGLPP